jgi:hypothetical protein
MFRVTQGIVDESLHAHGTHGVEEVTVRRRTSLRGSRAHDAAVGVVHGRGNGRWRGGAVHVGGAVGVDGGHVLVGEAAEWDAGRWCARSGGAPLPTMCWASWDCGRAGGFGNGSVEAGEGGQGGVHVVLGGVALHNGVLAFGETNRVLDARATKSCVLSRDWWSFHDRWWHWWH